MSKLVIKRLNKGPIGYMVQEVTCWEGANRVTEAFNMAVQHYPGLVFSSRAAFDKFRADSRALVKQLNEMNPGVLSIYKEHTNGDGFCIDLVQNPADPQMKLRMILVPVDGFINLKSDNNESNL